MGLYYRIELPEDSAANQVFLAPSCAVILRNREDSEPPEFMWIDNAAVPVKTKNVSVLTEDEVTHYGVSRILSLSWCRDY